MIKYYSSNKYQLRIINHEISRIKAKNWWYMHCEQQSIVSNLYLESIWLITLCNIILTICSWSSLASSNSLSLQRLESVQPGDSKWEWPELHQWSEHLESRSKRCGLPIWRPICVVFLLDGALESPLHLIQSFAHQNRTEQHCQPARMHFLWSGSSWKLGSSFLFDREIPKCPMMWRRLLLLRLLILQGRWLDFLNWWLPHWWPQTLFPSWWGIVQRNLWWWPRNEGSLSIVMIYLHKKRDLPIPIALKTLGLKRIQGLCTLPQLLHWGGSQYRSLQLAVSS